MAYIFGMFRRTALYGVVALIVTIFVRKIEFMTILKLSKTNVEFKGFFTSFLLLCLIVFPIIEILFVVYRKLSAIFGDSNEYGLGDFFTTFFRDITYPFLSFGTLMRGIYDRDFISTALGWVETIFGFVWTFGWIGFMVFGVFMI